MPNNFRGQDLLHHKPQYANKVLQMQPANLLGYWPLWESGVLTSLEERGSHHYTSSLNALPLMLGPTNKTRWYYGGSGLVNIYSAGLGGTWNPNAGGFIVRAKASSLSLWSDTNSHRIIHFLGGSVNDSVTIRYDPTEVKLAFRRFGNAAYYEYSQTMTDVNWMTLGINYSVAGNYLNAYIDGVKNAGISGGGVMQNWATSLVSAVIGAYDTAAAENWDGWISDAIFPLNGVIPSDSDMSTIHTKLANGTLVQSDLDTLWGAGNWAWWSLIDRDILDLSQVNAGARTANVATATGIGDGHTALVFNGTSTYVDAYSPSLAFSGAPFTLSCWFQVAAGTWSDVNQRVLMVLAVDSNNYAIMYKGASPNQNKIAWQYDAGATLKTVVSGVMSATTWQHMAMTASAANGMKAWLNGSQVGVAQTGLGTWAGVLSRTQSNIGCNVWSPISAPWLGNAAHAAVWNAELTPTQISQLATVP